MVTFLGFLVFLVVPAEASGGGTGSDGFVMDVKAKLIYG